MQLRNKSAAPNTNPEIDRLLKIEQRYTAFVNNISDGVWCFETDHPLPITLPEVKIIRNILDKGILVDCNLAFAKMHQHNSVNDLIGTPLHSFISSSEPQTRMILKNFIRGGFRLNNIEYRHPSKTGQERVYILNLYGIIENDCLVQAWGIQRDITNQYRAQEKLKKSENRYRNIFDYAFDAILIESLDGQIFAVNKRATEMLGYSQAEFLNMTIHQLIPEDFKTKLPNLTDRLKAEGVVVFQAQNIHKDGHLIDVEICTKLLSEEEHNLAQVFVRDISQQKFFQEQIQSLSAQIEQFSRISADIITITDEKELFQRISNAIVEISDFSRVLFYTFKDTPPYRVILGHVGLSAAALSRISKADAPREKYLALFEKGRRLGNQSCYIPHTMKHLVGQYAVDYGKREYSDQTGGWHREDNLLVAMKNKSGELISMISLDDSKSGRQPRDETVKPLELFANHISQILHLKQLEEERHKIEEQFQQSEKLRALGEMAGGVAHDFNNVLSAILGRAQLLKRDVNDPEMIHGLEIIEKAAMDGAATVRRIQEFTRLRKDQDFNVISINEIIRDSIKYTQTRWKSDADERGIKYSIKTDFQTEPLVLANGSEMREVFTNIILNAIEAMPAGGLITCQTVTVNETVHVIIRDTGCGMDSRTLKRIFDPFFTTKGVKGTGLGLSVSFGIIHRHNGTIDISSEPGEGTAVSISLPRYSQKQPIVGEESRKKPRTITPGLSAKILVVDDEEDPRILLKDILEMYQHQVLTAESGAAALEILEKEPDIRIIFSDLGMPDMSGWELSKAIKSRFPESIVVFITGWGTQLNQKRLSECGVERVIAKPFQVDQIKNLVLDYVHLTGRG